ncbi:hypothetical protein PAMP_018716 [Pampus punctatissimus]
MAITLRCKTHRCCECSASLSHWYYEKDGQLFCKKDYWAKFGELCHGCNDPITTGLIMGWLLMITSVMLIISSQHMMFMIREGGIACLSRMN